MSLNFNHLNAAEQVQFGSITTPLFANGAITSNKFGTAASVVIQDITYTAVNGGAGGNSITIQYIENGIASLETVEVTGTAIVVNIGNHTVLGSTATQVQTAITTSFAASLLVTPVITGTPSNIQLAVSATHLTGGITGAAMVTSIHADSSSNLVGAVQLISGSNVTLSQSGQAITVNVTGELSQALTNNHIFVGNGSNIATDVPMSGDATIISGGALTLANTGVTPSSYTNIALTVDSKGRITSASSGTTSNLTEATSSVLTITGGTGSVLGSGTSIQVKQSSGSQSGYLSSSDWTIFNNKQSTLTLGNLTDAGTDGITVTGGTGSIVGSGTSLSQHVADTTHNGYLSSTDWNTFNNKQPSGSYITALTGDATASGPGSSALTFSTVNSNIGSFTIANITVNAKGLITAASSPSTTGTGNVVLSSTPTLITPNLGTPNSGNLGNCTGLSLTSGVTGILPIANGGTNTATPSLVAGTNITITGSWPNQTVNSTGGSGTPAGSNTQIQFNNSGAFGASPDLTFASDNLTITSAIAPSLTIVDNSASNGSVILLNSDAPGGSSILFQNASGSSEYCQIVSDTNGNLAVSSETSLGYVSVGNDDTANRWYFNSNGSLLPPLLSSEPSSPAQGWIIYNVTTHHLEYYNGTTWVSL